MKGDGDMAGFGFDDGILGMRKNDGRLSEGKLPERHPDTPGVDHRCHGAAAASVGEYVRLPSPSSAAVRASPLAPRSA